MQKKLFAMVVLSLVLGVYYTTSVRAETVIVDGKALADSQIIVENGSLLVSLRPVCEALGAEVVWNADLQNIKITTKDTEIFLYIGVRNAFVNRVAKPILSPPCIVDGQTFIPLRLVGETLGAQVKWNEATKTVTITSQTYSQTNADLISPVEEFVVLPSGLQYKGNLVNGQPDGQGTMVYPDGSSYQGQFKNGLMHGYGEFLDSSGGLYSGDFAEGKKSGQGTFLFKDGKRYTGGWMNGQYNGYGEFYFEDGTTYLGNFEDGLSEGEGTIYYPDGRRLSGFWHKGKFVGSQG